MELLKKGTNLSTLKIIPPLIPDPCSKKYICDLYKPGQCPIVCQVVLYPLPED